MNDLLSIYQQIADGLADEVGATDTLLHVHAGMLVLLIARVVTGRSLGTLVPLSAVVIAALVNEIFDYIHQGQLRMPDAVFDLLNTVFWPFVLMAGIKVRGRKQDRLPEAA